MGDVGKHGWLVGLMGGFIGDQHVVYGLASQARTASRSQPRVSASRAANRTAPLLAGGFPTSNTTKKKGPPVTTLLATDH
ncbi:hypothetical protein, partial [Streptomyces sp. NPDC057747]|uniref:hypothetical protein n=1 Tax=Streptomyces sp. NPDC057747 TaxID=3346238 RepID=UPI003698B330